jgi:hypothetical protein
MTFDLIFVDGLHLHEQTLKDIENSLKHLNPNGRIVVHDCLPINERMQGREYLLDEWCGDVWKSIAILRTTRDDLQIKTYDMDFGCAVIKRGKSEKIASSPDMLTWQHFSMHKSRILNVVPAPDLDNLDI